MNMLPTKAILVATIGTIVMISSLTGFFDTSGQVASNEPSTISSAYGIIDSYQQAPVGGDFLDQLTGSHIKEVMNTLGIPDMDAYLPNVAGASSDSAMPGLYSRSPAPMGVADYGFMEPSGIKVPYAYTTTSFMGSAMFEDLSARYLMNSAPNSVSIQLNTVLDGVTVMGTTGYVYWVQNVMFYTPSTGEVTLVDNIWNLSSPSMYLGANSLLSGSGQVAGNLFYYYEGPSMKLNGSFTLTMYVTTGLVNGNDAVHFAYSISKTEMNQTVAQTTYDSVVFNSGSQGSWDPVPAADFRVDGNARTPSGLLYDAELVMGGPGGGSMTDIYSANGQFSLKFMDSTGVYTRLPAAYNFGSNGGETVQGLSSWWTSLQKPLTHLSAGPSLLVSMWGSQVSHSGAVNINGNIDPANGFIFMSMGTAFDNSTAAWAPVSQNGSFKYSLPGRISYSGVTMLSNYQPAYFTIAAETENETVEGEGHHGGQGGGGEEGNETPVWVNTTLNIDPSAGIYTPLIANGNDQLHSLEAAARGSVAFTGNGTIDNPYVITHFGTATLNPLFSYSNTYMYPSFPGIEVSNTNASVLLDHPPVMRTGTATSGIASTNEPHVPASNNLNYVFYNTTGITMTGAGGISGWFADTMTPPFAASVQFMYSHDFLVAANTFSGMSTSLLVYNPDGSTGGGTIWGNHFTENTLPAMAGMSILSGVDPLGIQMESSGNLVYNNYFATGNPVSSPAFDHYTGKSAQFSNAWSLAAKEPLSYVKHVHGMELHGSVAEVGFQGGNYWQEYNDPAPYNVTGNIAVGADYLPLVSGQYNVVFHSEGLATGIGWSVIFDGVTRSTTGSDITFTATNGSYQYEVLGPGNYSADPARGYLVVYGLNVSTTVSFTPVLYPVTFVQSGLPAGAEWGVAIAGSTHYSTGGNLETMLQNGSYAFTTIDPEGMGADNHTGTANVYGNGLTVYLSFSLTVYSVTFSANGLPSGTSWALNIDGVAHETSSPYMTIQLAPGNHSYSVSGATGYTAQADSGYVNVSNDGQSVSVQFSQNPDYGRIALLLVVGVAGGMAAGGAGMYLLWNKGKK